MFLLDLQIFFLVRNFFFQLIKCHPFIKFFIKIELISSLCSNSPNKDQVYESCNLDCCNQKLRTKVHKHDPTGFPNISLVRKSTAQFSGLSMNGVQLHLHVATYASIYLGVLSLHVQNFTWQVNSMSTL